MAAIAASDDVMTPTAVARRAGVSGQWPCTFDEALEAIRAARSPAPTARSAQSCPRHNGPRSHPCSAASKPRPTTTSAFGSACTISRNVSQPCTEGQAPGGTLG